MIIYPIVYPSALQFWLSADFVSEYYLQNNEKRIALPCDYHLSSVRSEVETLSQKYFLPVPIRFQVPKTCLRVYKEEIVSSIKSYHIPENCFILIDDPSNKIPVYVASPEYCFLKAASYLTLNELILLGYQLCGKYVPDNHSIYNQRSRKPITNTFMISAFLKQCRGASGVKKAKRAIAYVLNNSNSPMESKIAMAIVLPLSMGGFGLKRPELNRDIYLSISGQKHLGYEKCCCDFAWVAEKVIGEYDSVMAHMNSQQFIQDKKRSCALNLSGYKVIHITCNSMNNYTDYKELFDSLRSSLKIRKHKDRLAKYEDERYELFKFLRTH